MPRPSDDQMQEWAVEHLGTVQERCSDLSEVEYAEVLDDYIGYLREEVSVRINAARPK